MEAAARKTETHSPPFCMKRFAPSALCTLVLGVVLGACPSSKVGGDTDNTHGAVTVSFNKNNRDAGGTEANPDNMTIRPPATTLGTLPTEPTRPGYQFVEWNMQSDGSGETFTEETPIQGKVHLMVYARWKPVLNAQLSTGTLTFSPIEEKLSLTLTVSGFKNEADANSVGLDTNIDELSWLSPRFGPHPVSGDTKTFVLNISYQGEQFTEAPTTLHLTLKNIPAGYEYAGGTQSLHIVPTNGKDKTRPIPVHKGNIERFNGYARTQGLALHYQLTENAKLEPPASPETSNWAAIGTETAPFSGSFDGGGHSISGLNIHSASDFQGLFGYIRGEDAVIKNLGLKDGSVSGSYYVGGVAGYNHAGTVQNCYVTNSVSGSGNYSSAGGVVGYNNGGTIQDSYAEGNVSVNVNGDYFYVGGVVGWNEGGRVQNSYATGNVHGDGVINIASHVGGVVGHNSSTGEVHNSHYAKGSVTSTANRSYAGGVVGLSHGSVQNCYATGDVEGYSYVGGVVGYNGPPGKVHNSYAKNNVSASGYAVGGVVGYNAEGEVHNSYHAKGSVISTASKSSAAGGVVGHNNGKVHNSYATGNVEGNNTVGGLIGYNYYDGEVQNCYATGIVRGNNAVGGVVGYNYGGKVQNSYATGDVNTSGYAVGGVVGMNEFIGTVQNCYATGSVSGSSYVGGVVGHNYYGKVQNCVALNPSVTLTPNDAVRALGRVAGGNHSTLRNNRARTGMQLIDDGSPSTPSSDNSNSENGADVSAEEYGEKSFWEKKLHMAAIGTQSEIFWDFENIWDWKEGLLPMLREVGGEQNPRV